MAGGVFTTGSQPVADINFNGGLNTTSGPLSLQNSESSDLQNIDFNTFGSILKRNGYTALNTTAITSSPASDGLWWYEYYSSGYQSKLIEIANGKFYKMDDLDGTPDDVTGSTTITAGNFCDFENWNNTVYVTNATNPPFYWTGSGNSAILPALVANSYTFKVSGVTTPPAVGQTYTNNGNTYTITYVSVSTSGSIIATSSAAPTESGTLVESGTPGVGDSNITFTVSYANVNITKAKFVVQYNNYLVLGNVTVAGVAYPSRFYWCELRDDTVWLATSFIEVSKDDGQQLMNGFVMGDRLVFFKERAAYNLLFTGDNAIPFTLSKSNSNVGCVAPFSIQEVENGLVFLSYDGFYYYDGNNSYKISTNITTTLNSYNKTRFYQARSMRQKDKQRYFCSLPVSGTTNDVVIVWDWLLNAWSKYTGIAGAAMTTVYVGGISERVYFADYAGFVYRMDSGTDDYPLNVRTAIDAYYYTNWKHYDDICDQKGILSVYLYFQIASAVINLVHSFDFATGDTYSQTFSTATSVTAFDVSIFDSATFSSTGGANTRRDITGRGRVVRFGFKNSTLGETFQIDGLGSFAHLESNV